MTQATTTPGLLNPPPKVSLLPPCAPNMQTQGACEPESGEGLPGKPCPSCTSFQVKAQGWTLPLPLAHSPALIVPSAQMLFLPASAGLPGLFQASTQWTLLQDTVHHLLKPHSPSLSPLSLYLSPQYFPHLTCVSPGFLCSHTGDVLQGEGNFATSLVPNA